MSDIPDKRLLELSIRRAEARASQVLDVIASLPDLSDNLRRPSDEEVESLRQELLSEATDRALRIERQLKEDRTPRQQPQAPVIPFDAEL